MSNTPTPSDPLQKHEFKPWTMGEPFLYCDTEDDKKHWEICLKPFMDAENARCKAWTEEIHNFLVFAGLFSGVLSGFVVQAYRNLLPDPNETIIMLLSQIANPANENSAHSLAPSTAARGSSTSPVRISILWFISLILSLTTALVGITCLQWIGEYLNYPNSLSPMEKLALYNMRQQAIRKWRVPEIIASVPVLLQIALVLFLAGLIDFILTLNNIVLSASIITVVSIPLTFILLTTLIPTFHSLWTGSLKVHTASSVPDQCPYKSSQSRLVWHATLVTRHLLYTWISWMLEVIVFRIWSAFCSSCTLCSKSGSIAEHYSSESEHLTSGYVSSGSSEKGQTLHPLQYTTKIDSPWTMVTGSWKTFDQDWTKIRNSYVKIVNSRRHKGIMSDGGRSVVDNLHRTTPDSKHISYDCAQGLHNSLFRSSGLLPRTELYKCLVDIDGRGTQEDYRLAEKDHSKMQFRYEETLWESIFNSGTDSLKYSELVELHIRLANYLLEYDYVSDQFRNQPSLNLRTYVAWNLALPEIERLALRQEREHHKFFTEISDQISHSISSYLKLLIEGKIKERQPSSITKAGYIRPAFMQYESEESIRSNLNFISTYFATCMNLNDDKSDFDLKMARHSAAKPSHVGKPSDLGFYTASFYAYHHMVSKPQPESASVIDTSRLFRLLSLYYTEWYTQKAYEPVGTVTAEQWEKVELWLRSPEHHNPHVAISIAGDAQLSEK